MSQRLRSRRLQVDGLSLHVVEGGAREKPTVLFLHGWPQDCSAFGPVMKLLGGEAHVVALDLPGIGGSTRAAPSNTKRALARHVRALVAQMGLRHLTLVGHDIGGQVAYAFLRAWPDAAERVVLMNIAIPGVEPWPEVIRNPQIWHFGFHAVPGLPEKLVAGRETDYFRFFYDRISARPGAIGAAAQKRYVRAYWTPRALHAGFEWYRAFPQDVKDNQRARQRPVDTPVLYIRGAKEAGLDLGKYLEGLRGAGLRNAQGKTIANCGHFTADEQPRALARALREFMNRAA